MWTYHVLILGGWHEDGAIGLKLMSVSAFTTPTPSARHVCYFSSLLLSVKTYLTGFAVLIA